MGHVLKSDGVCFSTEKRAKVLDFALTVKQKQLKSFLGLVNYFRDDVQSIPHKVKSLNDIMSLIKRACLLTGHLDWSNASGTYRSQWVIPQTLLRRLEPPDSRTHRCLRYGIGGYILQLDQQQELPIRFISKALLRRNSNVHL